MNQLKLSVQPNCAIIAALLERVMLLQQLSPSFRELIMYNTMRAVIVFKQIEQALVNIMPSRSLNIGSAIYKDSLNIEL